MSDLPESAPAVDPLALEEQVCFALSVAARGVVGVYRPILAPLGLTHPQYLVMLALWQQSPLRANDLSRILHIDPATLSPLLKRLESSGLVERGRDPRDERALAVDLTAAGRALRSRALEVPPTVVAQLGIGLDRLQDLHRSLTELIEATDRVT